MDNNVPVERKIDGIYQSVHVGETMYVIVQGCMCGGDGTWILAMVIVTQALCMWVLGSHESLYSR